MPAQSEQETLGRSLEHHCDDARAQLTSSKVTTRKVGPLACPWWMHTMDHCSPPTMMPLCYTGGHQAPERHHGQRPLPGGAGRCHHPPARQGQSAKCAAHAFCAGPGCPRQHGCVLTPAVHAAAASWPGLCTILMQSVEKELAASMGKKKGPEAALSRTFKRLVQTAEDERRSGQAPLLHTHHGLHGSCEGGLRDTSVLAGTGHAPMAVNIAFPYSTTHMLALQGPLTLPCSCLRPHSLFMPPSEVCAPHSRRPETSAALLHAQAARQCWAAGRHGCLRT